MRIGDILNNPTIAELREAADWMERAISAVLSQDESEPIHATEIEKAAAHYRRLTSSQTEEERVLSHPNILKILRHGEACQDADEQAFKDGYNDLWDVAYKLKEANDAE